MSYSLAMSKAVLTMMFVGDKVRQGLYEFVPSRVISESLGIAAPSLSKLLQGLSRAKLLTTREGAKGGIQLSRSPESISLLDVFLAVESDRPLFRSDWEIPISGRKPTAAQKAVKEALKESEEAMKNELRNTRISDLLTALD